MSHPRLWMGQWKIKEDRGNRGVFAAVHEIVKDIPEGRVTTYGAIACMLGYHRGARTVGWAMKAAPPGLPCHRVVDARGRILCKQAGHREKLGSEGVTFKPNGCVDLEKHLW